MSRRGRKSGRGLVNKLIDLLPFEAHIPGGYRYCGPGTKLKERLARGDPGINKLDEACKEHDVQYSRYSDSANRNKADLVLADKAWERVKAGDSSLSERAAAYAVTNLMKLKAKVGAGCGSKTGVGTTKKKRPPVAKKKKVPKKKTVARVIPLPVAGGDVRSALGRLGVARESMGPAVAKIRSVVGSRRKNVKLGRGLYLRPYRSGYGLYLKPWRSDLN